MYVVIFKANVALFDEAYSQLAQQLRERAFAKYGCLGFDSANEGGMEIALSYWPSLQHIRNWKNDPLHVHAQQKGREKWYSDFSVEICELVDSGKLP